MTAFQSARGGSVRTKRWMTTSRDSGKAEAESEHTAAAPIQEESVGDREASELR